VQSGRVNELIRNIRSAGLAVVLITHNLPFVFQVADRMEVMRLGARVARFPTEGTSMEDVVSAMTGALVQEDTL
jgi:simple sugar transport system ATP-binding protein